MPRPLQRILTALLLLGAVVALEFGLETLLPDAAGVSSPCSRWSTSSSALSLNVINGMAGQFPDRPRRLRRDRRVHRGGRRGQPAPAPRRRRRRSSATRSSSCPRRCSRPGSIAGALRPRGRPAEPPAARRLPRHRDPRLRRDLPPGIATATTGGPDQGAIGKLLGALGGPIGYAGPDDTGVAAVRRPVLDLRRRRARDDPRLAAEVLRLGRALRASARTRSPPPRWASIRRATRSRRSSSPPPAAASPAPCSRRCATATPPSSRTSSRSTTRSTPSRW